jgi:hypothetical protein
MNIAQEILTWSAILLALSVVVFVAWASVVRLVRWQRHRSAIDRELQSMLQDFEE